MIARLTILGNNSAAPTLTRNQSGQHLTMGNLNILIDCGEGTQKRLMLYGINYQKISSIFISHLHGDHYLGLLGLLNTMSLNGRQKPLKVVSPPGLQEIVKLISQAGASHYSYDIEFISLEPEKEHTLDLGSVEVVAIPVTHRVPCFSYQFIQKQTDRPLNVEACKEMNVPVEQYKNIKSGADYTRPDGTVISNSALTFDPAEPLQYGYITDTLYRPDLAPRYQGFNAVYHEATYLHNFLDRAKKTNHSTAQQAAMFAKEALVKQLLIGHFSSRYDNPDEHLVEARSIFTNTIIAEEGQTFEIS